MSSSPAYRPGPVMGGRGGVSLPPPYRAPPISAPGLAPPPKPGPGPTGQPYSRFNISEPNVAGPGQVRSHLNSSSDMKLTSDKPIYE